MHMTIDHLALFIIIAITFSPHVHLMLPYLLIFFLIKGPKTPKFLATNMAAIMIHLDPTWGSFWFFEEPDQLRGCKYRPPRTPTPRVLKFPAYLLLDYPVVFEGFWNLNQSESFRVILDSMNQLTMCQGA